MEITNKFLFNFAVSYSGGGFKRLYEYAKWFNHHGGAWFIIHPRCEGLINEFPDNRFFPVAQPRYQRVFNDCGYLDAIGREIGQPDLYYSYGIPVYARFGTINWFHLSNVLPLRLRSIPLPLSYRLKLGYLGWRIKNTLQNADVISAESNFSLGLMDAKHSGKYFLSVNGSNDELAYLQNKCAQKKEHIAVVLGTETYKALDDSCLVFDMLRQGNSRLELMIIGNERLIPGNVRRKSNVIPTGVLPRSEVIEWLRKAKYYISTTYIENSYNAASEGVCFADESYVSDLGPHREFLKNVPFDQVSIPGMRRPVLHVRRENMSGANLKTWEQVITEVIEKFHLKMREAPAAAEPKCRRPTC
jgi:hypothetical protein